MILTRTGSRSAAVTAVPEPGDGPGATPPRWTWDDTNRWYPRLLADGVRVERAHDLRLAHALLRTSALTAGTPLAVAPPNGWDSLEPAPPPSAGAGTSAEAPATLFDLDELTTPRGRRSRNTRNHADSSGTPEESAHPAPSSDDNPRPLDMTAELAAQMDAIASSTAPGRLRLLIAAESAGALAAAEMHHAGLPWRAEVHDEILTRALGPRPHPGSRPAKLEELARRIREALDAPSSLNPDSHVDLLRAMEYAGVGARSLRKWHLETLDHPVIEPLLEYKSLYRLFTANGWNWLDTWAPNGRFRMEYVVGGVVTGRWASTGGGALQLPHSVRRAVVADPGWTFVVADVAQLEPRVLAGLAHDETMAAAGQVPSGTPDRAGSETGPGGHGRGDASRGNPEGVDMYAGMVAAGVVDTREQAKLGMLGAMYGGTTGVSAQVLPQLARAFPKAINLVERAAQAGERGEVVTTHLGRTSPLPGSAWADAQARAFAAEGDGAEAGRQARSQARAWGRFTRNFVVQGTAAEWALCWIASLRRRLWALGRAPDGPYAERTASSDIGQGSGTAGGPRAAGPGATSGEPSDPRPDTREGADVPEPFAHRPHLVFFLHDEVVVHTPAALAEAVAHEVRAAAEEAGRLLFGDFPVTFPLSVATVDSYADAKD